MIGWTRRLVCWVVVAALFAAVAWVQAGCSRAPSTLAPKPTFVPSIRHRDALALLPEPEDLGEGYVRAEAYRLAHGKGWDEKATRLSGYRAVYEGGQGAGMHVTTQVECYLSVADAQLAYRAYQSLLGEQIKSNPRYTVVNEYEQDLLGDWAWAFEARDEAQETYHYVYVRENVLVESVVTGPRAANLRQETVRMAQVVDQRIGERN